MKLLLIALTSTLTACSSLDNFVCYGAGTCNTTANTAFSPYSSSYTPAANGQVITTNGGNYVIVRSQTSGQVMSIIKSGK
jgi:hypothetical protein